MEPEFYSIGYQVELRTYGRDIHANQGLHKLLGIHDQSQTRTTYLFFKQHQTTVGVSNKRGD
jgi:hypothetical protein